MLCCGVRYLMHASLWEKTPFLPVRVATHKIKKYAIRMPLNREDDNTSSMHPPALIKRRPGNNGTHAFQSRGPQTIYDQHAEVSDSLAKDVLMYVCSCPDIEQPERILSSWFHVIALMIQYMMLPLIDQFDTCLFLLTQPSSTGVPLQDFHRL